MITAEQIEALYDSKYGALIKAAMGTGLDYDLSRDAVQDVFADLWFRKNQIDLETASLYTYTARAVQYVAVHMRWAHYIY